VGQRRNAAFAALRAVSSTPACIRRHGRSVYRAASRPCCFCCPFRSADIAERLNALRHTQAAAISPTGILEKGFLAIFYPEAKPLSILHPHPNILLPWRGFYRDFSCLGQQLAVKFGKLKKDTKETGL
jgi:hypothetical protein